jgi:hypothetical protein
MTDQREAPAPVEQKLVEAFRAHHARRRAQHRGLAAALAIAALLAVVSFLYFRPKEVRPPAAPVPYRAATAREREPIPAPVAAVHKVRYRPHPKPEVRQREVTTDFLPLDAAGYAPANGEVVRVEMPRTTLSLFGLPVDARRAAVPIRADVLLGEDGMAHAVRFVTTTSYEVQTGR